MATGLGERMKSYEAATDKQLPADQPTLIRIDGPGFSKFTKGATDLLAYTQSDELTLVCPMGCRAFNGRVAKLASLAAAYASVRFNHHLAAAAAVPAHKEGIAHFDACPTAHRQSTWSYNDRHK
ncbi:hypothetical protein B0H17DRAFT_1191976 [Mycena rosella]|uniref:tRNAHis guanylyltransferase catalytic domain-containing protein n=1 Tax=Mycena rosella TaxID=1033263 RepID=A0AAD7M9X5_MYCRO|nr:hypothetical protein B0H17DRAFT_1191976 [Mycena rosella]